jgi:urea transport system permease protein
MTDSQPASAPSSGTGVPTVTTNSPVQMRVPPASAEKLAAPPAPRCRGWAWTVLLLLAVFAPPFVFADDEFRLNQFARFAALALFALSVDLIWGYTGLLSLGQGLFFGLGAYVIGYSLILQAAALNAGRPLTFGPHMAMPDFMMQCRLPGGPIWIGPLINIWLALAVAILLPTITAMLFGWLIFARRIKGVYFSLLTQALVFAVYILVFDQRPYTGGVDGLTGLTRLKLFGYTFKGSFVLYFLIAGIVIVCFLGLTALMASKFGRVLTAIRDSENRVLALGYNTAAYKTFAFTLAGALAGLAGALYVAANRSAGPQFFSITDSIEVVIFVAVGGRGTLSGPLLGTFLVNLAKTYANEAPATRDYWPVLLGALFIGVVIFMPEGLVGWLHLQADRIARRRAVRQASGLAADEKPALPMADGKGA